MCLSRVDKKVEATVTLIESGWKHFSGGKLDHFPFRTWHDAAICPLDMWVHAEGDKADGANYGAGFHIFRDEERAKKKYGTQIRRVYFRRPTAIGVDQEIETVVAKEMYVPAKQEAWPIVDQL